MRRESADLPGDPVPDRVPDQLVARYGREARRTVRRRPPARALARVARLTAAGLRDGNVWALTFAVFLWSVTGAAVLGGLVFAFVRWPWVGLYVLAPILAMLSFSFAVALSLTRRQRSRELLQPGPRR